jgi:glucose/arabinose dehydrogenase
MKHFPAIVLALLLAACSSGGTAQEPKAAQLTDSAFDGRLWVPQGFTVSEFAKVSRARFMALGPDGAVYVSQPRDGQVTRLVDADGDGKAESQSIAVSGLDRPHGLTFHDGWLYIANTGDLVRVRLDAAGKATGTPERVAQYSGGSGHWTRTVLFGADGGVYVSIGSSCNVCEEKNEDRAAVMRYDADGSNGRLFSRGLRNAVGMAVHPQTKQIWVTQNERDNLKPEHEDLPFEEINILTDGGDFGWPFCHGDRVPNPEYSDQARCTRTIPPALKLQAHSAPLGISFLDRASKFPEAYRGDALVALHGSWNRDVPTGAKVIRVKIENGKPVSSEDFISGWQGSDGKRWGRPVDVLVGKDGAVLISDDQGGIIYRVTH